TSPRRTSPQDVHLMAENQILSLEPAARFHQRRQPTKQQVPYSAGGTPVQCVALAWSSAGNTEAFGSIRRPVATKNPIRREVPAELANRVIIRDHAGWVGHLSQCRDRGAHPGYNPNRLTAARSVPTAPSGIAAIGARSQPTTMLPACPSMPSVQRS